MSAGAQEPTRLPPSGRRRPRSGAGQVAALGVVAVVVVAAALAIASSAARDRRGVRGLPPEQRAALLSRTVDELRRECGGARASALEAHCRELASFAASFDECRADCAALTRPLLAPTPTR